MLSFESDSFVSIDYCVATYCSTFTSFVSPELVQNRWTEMIEMSLPVLRPLAVGDRGSDLVVAGLRDLTFPPLAFPSLDVWYEDPVVMKRYDWYVYMCGCWRQKREINQLTASMCWLEEGQEQRLFPLSFLLLRLTTVCVRFSQWEYKYRFCCSGRQNL